MKKWLAIFLSIVSLLGLTACGSRNNDGDEKTDKISVSVTFDAMHRKVFQSFPISRVYQAHIPTCPSGYWAFGFASKKYHPISDFNQQRWNARGIKTSYYTTNLHLGAFMKLAKIIW